MEAESTTIQIGARYEYEWGLRGPSTINIIAVPSSEIRMIKFWFPYFDGLRNNLRIFHSLLFRLMLLGSRGSRGRIMIFFQAVSSRDG